MKHKQWIVGGLMLAMLVLCAAIISVLWASASQVGEVGFRWDLFHIGQVSVEASEEKRLAVSEPATLVVQNLVGDITIIKGAEDEISLTAHKTAWGSTEAEAQAALARLQLDISQENHAITVQVEPKEMNLLNEGEPDSVQFMITVPAETTVTAYTGSGQVELSGVTGQVNLQSDYGDIVATDVKGGLIAHTASGNITAQNIQGDAQVLDLSSDYGDISLERATARQVKAHSSSGLIQLAEVKAEGMDLSSDYGDVQFEAGWTAQLEVKTGSGVVTLAQLIVDKELAAGSDYGDVRLTQVLATTYNVSASSGAIKLDGVTNSVKAHSDYGDVVVTNAQKVTLDLSTNSGTIQFAGSLADAPHRFETDYGDVRLTLPENSALNFDLSTDYGQISSDLPLTLSGLLEETHWRGTFNGGGTDLTASTGSGNISIETLNPGRE